MTFTGGDCLNRGKHMKPHVVTVVVVLPLLLAGLCSGCATYHPSQPIHIAAEKGDLAGVQAAVTADRKSLEVKGEWGCRPLHIAAEKGQVAVVEYLLEKGADPHARDALTWTPLQRAGYGGQPETARLLLDAGARMNVRDRQGLTCSARARLRRVSRRWTASRCKAATARRACCPIECLGAGGGRVRSN